MKIGIQNNEFQQLQLLVGWIGATCGGLLIAKLFYTDTVLP
jgi:hypothetical protein